MSLLQEALKRKEQEGSQSKPEGETTANAPASAPVENKNPLSVPQEGGDLTVPQASPPQSMPVLNPLRAEEAQSLSRKSSMLWVIVAVIAIFVSATITAGFVYFFYRFLPSSKAKIVQAVPPNVPPVSVPLAGTNQVAAQPAPEQPPAAALTQNAPMGAVPQQAAGMAARQPVSAKPAFLRTKTPAAAPAVQWPLLKLSGILRGAGRKENTALINGKMINIGQTIENVTLVEIQSDGVILQYGAEKRFLRVGAVSY